MRHDTAGSNGYFDALGEIHRFDELEALLDYATRAIVDQGEWGLALITFYLGEEVFYGLTGGDASLKARFREAFRRTSRPEREAKRDAILAHSRPGTNICFIPAGEGPKPGMAYVVGRPTEGDWDPHDRLMIMMRDWQDRILGVLSLDNPTHGNRPDEEGYRRLAEIDHFVNVVGKIAENRFWSLRLLESEEAYRSIFDSATDGFFIVDSEGRIAAVNPAACQMHGHPCGEMIGTDVRDILHPDSRPIFEGILAEVAAGRAAHAEAVSLHRDDRPIDVEIHALRFLYRGRPHMLAVVRDITERKRMFERLLEKQKEESIVALAGGVAHDYNNILMGITGSLSLLRRNLPATGEATRHCDRIESSARKLSDLTNQLLAVARGLQSESRPLHLEDVIRETLPLLEGLVRTTLTFEVDLEEGLWPVVGDRVQLTQVLMNLSLNAWEAMGGGGTLRIRAVNEHRLEEWTCRRTGTHPAGDYVAITVSDDGEGMDAETRHRVFEPYFSTKSPGRGLGLAAVLGIIRRHSGAVDISSPTEGGTVVTILLPRCPAELLEEEVEERFDEPSAEIRNILLVDDEEVVRDVTSSMLVALGCLVTAVEDGPSAIEAYRARDRGYDLVLLDVQMPGLSGPKVAEAIRAIDSEARILLSSGHAEALVKEQYDTTRFAAGFLQKPYTLDELGKALDAILVPA